MLNAVEDRARQRGWLIVSETATPGFVSRMTQQHLPRLLRDFDPKAVQRRMSGVSAPLNIGGVTWSTIEAHVVQASLRNQLEMLADLLAEQRTGVLITLDEIHHNQIEELRELATVVQHTFRENRELAFAGAGLAASVSDVVNDDVLTFLRRAERHTLGSVARVQLDMSQASQSGSRCPPPRTELDIRSRRSSVLFRFRACALMSGRSNSSELVLRASRFQLMLSLIRGSPISSVLHVDTA